MKAHFNYPVEFETHPDYRAHSGQVVEIMRALSRLEADFHDDPQLERMFKIRAVDGWQGDAFESELLRPKNITVKEFAKFCDGLVRDAAK